MEQPKNFLLLVMVCSSKLQVYAPLMQLRTTEDNVMAEYMRLESKVRMQTLLEVRQ